MTELLILYSLGTEYWRRREEKLSIHLSLAVAELTASFNLHRIDQIDFSPPWLLLAVLMFLYMQRFIRKFLG